MFPENCLHIARQIESLSHGSTFLAFGEAFISLRAFAPLSRASGSNDGGLISASHSAYVTLPAAKPAASFRPWRHLTRLEYSAMCSANR